MKPFLDCHPRSACLLLACDSAPVNYPSAPPGPEARVENREWRPIDADKLKQDIAQEVEKAFANVPYPGDDKLLAYPDSYGNRYLLATFRGKHWRDITPEMLIEHQHRLSLFSPEAFRFFLPCLLKSAMLHGDVTEFLWETVFYNLTPGHRDMEFLNERINLLNTHQKAVLRRYIELYAQIEITDRSTEQALAFWRQITEPTNPR